MYELRSDPIVVKPLLMAVAKVPIPAVAARPTKAIINTYSTKPWPSSSQCNRARALTTELATTTLLTRVMSSRGGPADENLPTGNPNDHPRSKSRHNMPIIVERLSRHKMDRRPAKPCPATRRSTPPPSRQAARPTSNYHTCRSRWVNRLTLGTSRCN